VTQPSTTTDGLDAGGLRFGDSRVIAILSALVGFCHLISGYTKGKLVERAGASQEADYTSRQTTYDLCRLKRKGLIEKIPHTRRYQLTHFGSRVAVLFTKTMAGCWHRVSPFWIPACPATLRRGVAWQRHSVGSNAPLTTTSGLKWSRPEIDRL